MAYNKAIELDITNTDLYCNAGNVLHSLKRYEESIKYYDIAISINPHYTKAYFNKANILS